MTPGGFLELLWKNKPDDQYVLLWTLQDKQSHWFRNVQEAGQFAAAATGVDIYVGVGCSATDRGPMQRCKSEEVSGVCGIGTDLDLKSEAHPNKPLPTTLADALTILPASMPPTIIIITGNGAHAWWLFKEPLMFDSDKERAEAARLATRWHTMLRMTSATHGWVYERLADLARILRIPGTRNLKDPACPKDVMVHSQTNRFYNASDLEEFLDDAGIPDPEAEERAARQWRERFDDKPLLINPTARIDQARIDAWMDPANSDLATAMRFQNTWEKRRSDLKDQTGSGYDMALADFGVEAGLTEQLIVDLIVHFRTLHGMKQRTKVDYYQRTIGKAQERSDKAAPVAPEGAGGDDAACPPAEAQGPSALPEAPEPAVPDPVADLARKTKLCDGIARRLGVPIVRLVKIKGKDPQYRMELATGEKIEFPTVTKFTEYGSVSTALMGSVGKVIPKIKPKEWDVMKQDMLDACVVVESTEELDWEGATTMHLQHYLLDAGLIVNIEDQPLQDQRKPMVIDGAITVCAGHFLLYVNKSTFQGLTVKAVAGMLSAIGATPTRVRSPKHKDQSRWVLPMTEFDPEEYKRAHDGAGGIHAVQ